MRLWTNIFLPVKALLEFLLTFKDETIAHKLNDTHKSNAGPLLLGAFADWAGNRLSLYLMEAGTDKGQDPLEIRAFRQKESTATLIHIVSKLRCFFGGSGGIRTHVPSRTTAFRVRLVTTTSIRFHVPLRGTGRPGNGSPCSFGGATRI